MSLMLRLREGCRDSSRIRAEHPLVHLALVAGENQIQEDPDDSRKDERGLHHQIETLLETLKVHIRSTVVENLIEPGRLDDIDESKTECDGQDETISSGELHHAEDSDPGDHNCAVKEDLHSPKDRRRHGRKDSAEFGKEAHENEKDRGGPSGTTGLETKKSQ